MCKLPKNTLNQYFSNVSDNKGSSGSVTSNLRQQADVMYAGIGAGDPKIFVTYDLRPS